MKLGKAGEDLIKGFEGYLERLPDGRCKAYLCPAGKATIGWGCTVGVRLGMVWTLQQAEDGFRREMADAERDVLRLVSVDLNQNQFDALVSFQYNCGKLGSSTLLKKLNKGDYKGAQAEFMKWVWATDPRTKQKVQLRGLARRRAAEAEMFARRTEQENIEREPEMMAQDADINEGMSPAVAHTINTSGTTAINTMMHGLPKPPAQLTESISIIGSWQAVGASARAMATAAWASPTLLLFIVGLTIFAVWGTTIMGWVRRWR